MEVSGQFYAPPCLTSGKYLPIIVCRIMGGPKSRSGRSGEHKFSVADNLTVFKTFSVCSPGTVRN